MHAIQQTIKRIQRLKQRTDLHLVRKAWHAIGVLLIALVYSKLTDRQALVAISIMWLLFVPFDFVRQKNPQLNDWILEKFGLLFRQHEAEHLAGTTYLVTGTWILVAFFPRDLAMLTILFLALADPLASLVGIRMGKIKILGAKSLEGSLAAFAVCTLISAIYFSNLHLYTAHLVIAAIVAGIIGALSELIPIFGLDDNLTFPLMSATLLCLMRALIH